MLRKSITTLLLFGAVQGCTQYPYAKNVKMVSYEDNVMVGKAVGPVRGESCQASVLGNPIGEPATLDKAMAAARTDNKIRYLNNISTESTGFDAGVYARRCLAVKGTGYE